MRGGEGTLFDGFQRGFSALHPSQEPLEAGLVFPQVQRHARQDVHRFSVRALTWPQTQCHVAWQHSQTSVVMGFRVRQVHSHVAMLALESCQIPGDFSGKKGFAGADVGVSACADAAGFCSSAKAMGT